MAPPTCASSNLTNRRFFRILLEVLFEHGRHELSGYEQLLQDRIERGNLSERTAQAVRRRAKGRSDLRPAIEGIYGELAQCLERNQPWDG